MSVIPTFRHQHAMRFAESLKRQGSKATDRALYRAFAELVQRYSEPHRGHHTNVHIAEMHLLIDLTMRAVEDLDAVFVGIEMHDAVYELPSSTNPTPENELRSAELSDRMLAELGLPQAFIDRVRRFIEVSQPSVARFSDDEKVFHDADFWILGSNPERYAIYRAGIEREFKRDQFPELYIRGRAHFLRGLLSQRRLFETSLFHFLFDRAARGNIRAELRSLEYEAQRFEQAGTL